MQYTDHWNTVYTKKGAEAVSWYEQHAQHSLSLIEGLHLACDAPVIDVGGGASTLVDDLLLKGFQHITVLDLAESALALAKHRLQSKAESVIWMAADVVHAVLPQHRYALWHDRAVFHFLLEPKHRTAYVENLSQAVCPGGDVIMATFSTDGPSHCSGLPVMRYSADTLSKALGKKFALQSHQEVLHLTPTGNSQAFLYCHFKAQL